MLYLLVNSRRELILFYITFNIINAYSVQPNQRGHTKFVLIMSEERAIDIDIQSNL